MGISAVLPEGDFSQYLGEWIVICNNKVIAHDRDLTKLDKDIKKCTRTPTVAKIPKKDTLLF